MGGQNYHSFLGPSMIACVGDPPPWSRPVIGPWVRPERYHWSGGPLPPSRLASLQLARSLRSQSSDRTVTLVLLLRFRHVRLSFGEFVNVSVNVSSRLDHFYIALDHSRAGLCFPWIICRISVVPCVNCVSTSSCDYR